MAPTLSSLTLSQLINAFADSDPTPGGGTASAVAGAMGAALLIMVTGLARSKTNVDAETTALAAARNALVPAPDRFLALADADTDAFNAVMAAYRLPKSGVEEKSVRSSAIQHALRGATEVPLDTLRACAAAMAQAVAVADCGHRSAASDVGVALGLIDAAAAGAAANVRINLEGLKDEAFKATAAGETERLLARVAESRTAAAGQLAAR